MASISKEKDRWRVQFVHAKRRYTARFDTREEAEEAKLYIGRLCRAASTGAEPDRNTEDWVKRAPASVKQSLATARIIEAVPCRTLAEFLDYCVALGNVKNSTMLIRRNIQRNLLSHFGGRKLIDAIGPEQAAAFREWLAKHGKDGQPLAATTVSKRCQQARQFFAIAVKRRWIRRNPFEHMTDWCNANPERTVFVPTDVAQKILDVATLEWKLIIALCRWGGLRFPSEVMNLKWSDVNWEQRLLRVWQPKTERFKPWRIVPIFPEVLPSLEQMWHAAEDGADVIFTRRKSAAAWRGDLLRLCARAGVLPWPRLFQNLRSSRETELVNKFPLHVACAWVGNSPRVAQRHYLQVTPEHLQQATGVDAFSDAQSLDGGAGLTHFSTHKFLIASGAKSQNPLEKQSKTQN